MSPHWLIKAYISLKLLHKTSNETNAKVAKSSIERFVASNENL